MKGSDEEGEDAGSSQKGRAVMTFAILLALCLAIFAELMGPGIVEMGGGYAQPVHRVLRSWDANGTRGASHADPDVEGPGRTDDFVEERQ